MIRAMIGNGGVAVMASGGTKELAAEVCALAGSVWSSMKKKRREQRRGVSDDAEGSAYGRDFACVERG